MQYVVASLRRLFGLTSELDLPYEDYPNEGLILPPEVFAKMKARHEAQLAALKR